jgi:hypothetical protein
MQGCNEIVKDSYLSDVVKTMFDVRLLLNHCSSLMVPGVCLINQTFQHTKAHTDGILLIISKVYNTQYRACCRKPTRQCS